MEKTNSPAHTSLTSLVLDALQDLKAHKILQLDVRALTSLTDTLFIATGNSDQHIRSIGEHVLEQVKKAGFSQAFPSDFKSSDWILIDLGGAVVHVMKQTARDYYALEKLWDMEEEPIAALG